MKTAARLAALEQRDGFDSEDAEQGVLETGQERLGTQAVRADRVAPFTFEEFEAEVQRLIDFAHDRGTIVREDVRRSPR